MLRCPAWACTASSAIPASRNRVYLHLANDWLAGEYRRAAELIDADTGAVAEMLAVQEVAVR